jgi:hypothetical protein
LDQCLTQCHGIDAEKGFDTHIAFSLTVAASTIVPSDSGVVIAATLPFKQYTARNGRRLWCGRAADGVERRLCGFEHLRELISA